MVSLAELTQDSQRLIERNWEAIIATIINLLTCLQALALIAQTRKVFTQRSAQGVSTITMSYYAFYFLAFLAYGIHKGAQSMILNSLQFIIYIPLLVGLWKYGDSKGRQTLSITLPCFALLPLIMIIIPWKETFLLCLLGGILFTVWLMYDELRKTKGVGSFEIKFQYAFLANSIFWFMYGVTLRDMPLMIFNPIAGILLTMIIVLYLQKLRGVKT